MSDNSKALEEGIVFGDAVSECLVEADLIDGEIAIVSRDCDYFAIGKAIKDAVEEKGIKTSNIALDDDFVNEPNVYRGLFEFSPQTKLVIAVGNDKIINMARYFATQKQIDCIAVPTVLTMFSVFAPHPVFFEKGLPQRAECARLKKLVCDLKFMSQLKKQAFADAFSEIGSKLVSLIDYKADCVLSDETADDLSIRRAYKIILSLADIDGDGAKTQLKIINAELKLGILSRTFENLYGTETTFGGLLAFTKKSSVFESMFYVNMPLIKLYELFLRADLTRNTVTADYNVRISTLAKVLSANEQRLISSYQIPTLDEIKLSRRKLAENVALCSLCEKSEQLAKKLASAYSFVYNGRQKRADFDFNDFKSAIKLAPYLGGSFLKLINDSGVIECVE